MSEPLVALILVFAAYSALATAYQIGVRTGLRRVGVDIDDLRARLNVLSAGHDPSPTNSRRVLPTEAEMAELFGSDEEE